MAAQSKGDMEAQRKGSQVIKEIVQSTGVPQEQVEKVLEHLGLQHAIACAAKGGGGQIFWNRESTQIGMTPSELISRADVKLVLCDY